MSMLEIGEVSKVYRTGTFGGELKLVLRRVSFNIDRGEVVSLIGQSGSGKSTLGKIILRLIALSAGTIKFEGTDISTWAKGQLRDYYRHVQGVFQDPFSSYNPLYKADRVFEMVRSVYFADLHGQQWHDKIESALEAVALNPGDVLNKFPHQLSGGQQQRLLIARALLLDVKLLIADEIISMLDASTRVDVLNLLVDLKRKGLGILFITHDLSLGNYISDKAVILREGAIVEMGETQKVFGNPKHSYTQSLLTAVPQLHRRWASTGDWARAGVATDGSAGGSAPTHISNGDREDEVFAGAESARYSKSSLNPGRASGQNMLAQAANRDRPGAGPRPSLMDMPEAPWQRRFGLGPQNSPRSWRATAPNRWWSANRAISWQSKTSFEQSRAKVGTIDPRRNTWSLSAAQSPLGGPPGSAAGPLWRYSHNPVIPRDLIPTSNSIFNSAVVPFDGRFAGVFRCDDWTRRMELHVGFSDDGFDWKIDPERVEFSADDPEIGQFVYGYDPRVVRIADRYYVTWCNWYHGPTIGVAWTDDFREFHQEENAYLPFNRNGVLFPRKINDRFAMLSRPSDNGHTPFGDIFYSESPDLRFWGRHRHVMSPVTNTWQATKVGGGPVPIETSEGWLLVYHGVLTSCNGFIYSAGVALLDLDEPWKVIARSAPYVLAPQASYECVGDVPNVVFPCAMLCDGPTGRVALYYGAADTVTALAFGYVQELVDFAKEHPL